MITTNLVDESNSISVESSSKELLPAMGGVLDDTVLVRVFSRLPIWRGSNTLNL